MGIVKRDGLKLSTISWAGMLLGYVNKIILFPKFLSVQEIGLANVLISIAILFAQFSTLGTPGVLLKFFPYFNDITRKHYGFLTWIYKIAISGSVLSVVVLIVCKDSIAAFFSEKSPLLAQYYFYIIPLGLATSAYIIFEAFLRCQFDTVSSSFANEIILRLAITVCITLYVFKIIDFESFIVLYVIANASPAIILLIYICKKKIIPITQVSTKVKRYSQHLIIFSLFSVLSGAGNNFIMAIDQIFVSGFIDLKATGIYTTVAFVSSVILVPYRAIIRITSPIVANFWSKKNMKEMEKLYKNVSVVSLLIGAYIFCGFWICIDDLFVLMPNGDVFKEGKYVFLILCSGRLFDMSSGINGLIILASEKYKWDLLFTIFLIFSTIYCNYLFINKYNYGMEGAAIATTITLVLYNLFRIAFLYYHHGIQPFTIHFIKGLIVIIILFVLMTHAFISCSPVVNIIIKGTILTLLYWPCMYLLKISPDINLSIVKFVKRLGVHKK